MLPAARAEQLWLRVTMYNLETFRKRVRECYRRSTPYDDHKPNQRDLAEAVGLDPTNLSKRMHGVAGERLSDENVRAIVSVLAEWGALTTQAEALELLALVNCPPFTAAQWQAPPLDLLTPPPAPARAAAASSVSPATNPNPPTRHNLPPPLTSFVGRQQELRELETLLGSTRLLTLTGIGGCGKTRLALELGYRLTDRFAGGVWLVELAALNDSSLLAHAVARTLGLKEQAGVDLVATLIAAVGGHEKLLIVDNCEHLVASTASLIHQLLLGCPNLRVLATSRETLRVAGEYVWPVPTLSLPPIRIAVSARVLPRYEAVRLFVTRAKAASPGFSLSEQNATAVRTVCEMLDGIPLALELAAARVGVLAVEQISGRLHQRFRLLTGGSRTASPRQQTLQALMDWSYDLLTAEEQLLFSRLAVFAGGCELTAVEVVCSDEQLTADRCLEVLAALVNKSLLLTRGQPGAMRYLMLETLREYATTKLSGSGEATNVQQRHAAYYLQMAETAEPELRGSEQAMWLTQLEAEHDNMRAALGWSINKGQSEIARGLSGALAAFWVGHGHFTEGREWLRLSLALSGDDNLAAKAKMLHGAANLALYQGDYNTARQLYEQVVVLQQQLHNQKGAASALNNLGIIAEYQGDYLTARNLYENSLSIQRELGEKWNIAASLNNLAIVVNILGDADTSSKLVAESLALRQELGDKRGVAQCLGMQADAAIKSRSYEAAQLALTEAVAIARALEDRWLMANLLGSSADVAIALTNYHTATNFVREAIKLINELQDRLGLATMLYRLARILVSQGQPTAAAILHGAEEALRKTIGSTLPPDYLAAHNELVASLQAAQNKAAYATAWAEGQAMSLDEVIAHALAATGD